MTVFVGLMSGTSLDGVDAVLAEWSDGGLSSPNGSPRLRELGFVHLAMPEALRAELLALTIPSENELHRAASAANAVAELYAEAVTALLREAGVEPGAVRALGAHGQTVRHRPRAAAGTGAGYTIQLLNGALLAERTGIDVVCDFRSRDVAAGGQGAPLVPAFHAEVFGREDLDVAVLNLGGIANLTLIGAASAVSGFDCGPGNMLLDLWSQRISGIPFDRDGAFAARGQVVPRLLESLLADPFFALAPPKSTGRELFDAHWLDGHLEALGLQPAEDVMATLAELTAAAACDALARHAPRTQQLLVCGGGAFNRDLLRRIAARAAALPARCAVASTAEAGIVPDRVEALAFAWLARAHVQRLPGNLSAVTGAAGPRVLGALHPA